MSALQHHLAAQQAAGSITSLCMKTSAAAPGSWLRAASMAAKDLLRSAARRGAALVPLFGPGGDLSGVLAALLGGVLKSSPWPCGRCSGVQQRFSPLGGGVQKLSPRG